MIMRKTALGAIFIFFCAGTVSAGGLGKAFSEASQALTSTQSTKAFSYQPVRNAQPPLVQPIGDGGAYVRTYSAPNGNGTGKWYEKIIEPSGVTSFFKRWSP